MNRSLSSLMSTAGVHLLVTTFEPSSAPAAALSNTRLISFWS